MRILEDVRQKYAHDCGRAAVRCVLRSYGISDRGLGLESCEQNGTHPASIHAALRDAGLQVFSGEIGDMLQAISRLAPIITPISLHGGHYVVVAGVRRGKVHFQDPLDGPSELKLAEWEAIWKDVDIFGTRYKRFGIVGQP
jgi:ABC-type bacteriocin/lantibiotic exporter with double-glycine peptidase domain